MISALTNLFRKEDKHKDSVMVHLTPCLFRELKATVRYQQDLLLEHLLLLPHQEIFFQL